MQPQQPSFSPELGGTPVLVQGTVVEGTTVEPVMQQPVIVQPVGLDQSVVNAPVAVQPEPMTTYGQPQPMMYGQPGQPGTYYEQPPPSAPASARAPVRTWQPGAHAGQGAWEWQGFANGPWRPYDRSTNAIIVAADGRGEGSVVALTDGYRHNVDFGCGTAKDLTTGAIHAIRHSVDAAPAADLVTVPYVPTGELHRRVHELVRAGKKISEKEARAYSRTLTEAQYTSQNKALLGVHRGGGCCVLNFISGSCLVSGPLVFLPCLCLWPCFCGLGREDPNHRFVATGEHGEHSCVIVDHERGKFACFYCGGFCCYCEKLPLSKACFRQTLELKISISE